jgi:hypothetical protein
MLKYPDMTHHLTQNGWRREHRIAGKLGTVQLIMYTSKTMTIDRLKIGRFVNKGRNVSIPVSTIDIFRPHCSIQ